MDKRQEHDFLLSAIPRGEQNARSMRDLARYLGVDRRAVRRVVNEARIAGCIICSSDNGYFLPEDAEDVLRHYRRAMCGVNTTLAALEPERAYLEDMGVLHE